MRIDVLLFVIWSTALGILLALLQLGVLGFLFGIVGFWIMVDEAIQERKTRKTKLYNVPTSSIPGGQRWRK
ncbi:hypothetical protein [Thermococcus peptonophilus]|uniref:Uncharacterized protein n=1 Tax=Thermococcus peptonophilus TaxID=53952 RepID=A0A142CWH7_9EURY|nr:hypothetical protein [Thermococcus peptonophilus]AMQ19129.1 hypothetical protein A0127_08100 [Thermococcus peptonophilus]